MIENASYLCTVIVSINHLLHFSSIIYSRIKYQESRIKSNFNATCYVSGGRCAILLSPTLSFSPVDDLDRLIK